MRPVLPAVALLAAVACGGGGDTGGDTGTDAGPKPVTVPVVRLAFDPAELAVPVGTTVTWRSDEPITHTVTSGEVTGVDSSTGLRAGERPDGRFDGPLDTTGATFSHTFATPGTYSYYCAIHKGMNASVVVT